MNRFVLVLGLASIGCEAKHSSTTASPGESVAGAPGELAQAASPGPGGAIDTNSAASAEYYTVEELRDLGLRTTSMPDGETLLCGPEGDSQCLCLSPLDCSAGGCMKFSENVTAFKSALTRPSPGSKVQCDSAATGECGSFAYFDFQGDLYRRELRWFDAGGALVGQRNISDYAAYCGKQTRARFVGRIPKCATATRRELLCGEALNTAPPLDDVRRYAGPRPRPTGTPRQ